MKHSFVRTSIIASALLLGTTSLAMANGLMGGLKSQLGSEASTATSGSGLGGLMGGAANTGLASSLGLPSLSGDMMGNVAGVLQYCVEQKYLSAANVDNVKDQLMDKVGLGQKPEPKQEQGYQQGLTGILSGGDGNSFDLNKIKGDIKSKACDYVLENAPSLL